MPNALFDDLAPFSGAEARPATLADPMQVLAFWPFYDPLLLTPESCYQAKGVVNE